MSSTSENSEDFLAKWLAGELTAEQKAKFESSEEGKEMMKILQSTDKLGLPPYDVEAELTKLQQSKQKELTKTRSLTPLWRMAVAAVLIVGLSLVYFLTKPNYQVYETQFGEIKTITLPDNSTVALNVNSVLKFDPETFNDNRKLILKGEAFFEVTKGINFQVNTDEGNVIVMGTSFNVKQRSENLEVQVHSGVVNVVRDEIDRILEKGDGLRIENGQLERSWALPVEPKPLWVTDNIVELLNVPLTEALESLRNSFGIVTESNISLTSERFTGSYPGDNVEMAIQIIMSAKGFAYTFDPIDKKLTIAGRAEN